jgi:hypothetical protein
VTNPTCLLQAHVFISIASYQCERQEEEEWEIGGERL